MSDITEVIDALEDGAMLLYNLCIMGGTAYLVADYDWSPAWFLLALLLLTTEIKG